MEKQYGVVFKSPYKDSIVLRTTDKGGYYEREESVREAGCPETVVTVCYTDTGLYLGDINTAKLIVEKLGLTRIQAVNSSICNVGWHEKNQHWYGWSHRAINCFGIGSVVKEGHSAYVPSNKEDFVKETLRFWGIGTGEWIECESRLVFCNKKLIDIIFDYRERTHSVPDLVLEIRDDLQVDTDKYETVIEGILVKYFVRYKGLPDTDPRYAGVTKSVFAPYPVYGKGEWKAETLDDAWQMAVDFADGVS